MIYRIKFISDEVDGFVREIKIDSEATFLDLNRAVLSSCGYPDDQMTSFYLCDEEWERGPQVTREDMGMGDVDEDIYVMESTRLSELIEDEGQRLEFIFDPFGNRCFYLDVKELITGEYLDEAVVLRSRGEAPVQIIEPEVEPTLPKGGKKAGAVAESDYDDDLFNDGGGFNDDEIDLDGFEISDGQPY